jgi:hypothetical protein
MFKTNDERPIHIPHYRQSCGSSYSRWCGCISRLLAAHTVGCGTSAAFRLPSMATTPAPALQYGGTSHTAAKLAKLRTFAFQKSTPPKSVRGNRCAGGVPTSASKNRCVVVAWFIGAPHLRLLADPPTPRAADAVLSAWAVCAAAVGLPFRLAARCYKNASTDVPSVCLLELVREWGSGVAVWSGELARARVAARIV